ncbi:hypothetical protein TNCV_3908471 [Trichonephila clavipes]|nr:hypothetical protein TNCV_3908471 [Trichonephila clavipes]
MELTTFMRLGIDNLEMELVEFRISVVWKRKLEDLIFSGVEVKLWEKEGFSYRSIGARVQRNSSTVLRVWKQWTDQHRTTRKTWQCTTEGDLCARRSIPPPNGSE